MPAAIALVSPVVFKQVLEYLGWNVHAEGKYNCTLVKDGLVLTIPKVGKLISRQLFECCLESQFLTPGDYFEALKVIGYKF
jgi:hypothetical protein